MNAATPVKIELVTHDPSNDEYVLYLIESGPWKTDSCFQRLDSLQQRILGSIEVVLSGSLASKFPQSKGRPARIQIDWQNRPPAEVQTLVKDMLQKTASSPALIARIAASPFVDGIRLVTRQDMGRE